MGVDRHAGAPMTADVQTTAVAEPLDARGLRYLAAGRFGHALETLRLALSLGDTRPSTALNLAIAEDRAGDRGRAQRLMRIVAASVPEWDEPALRLAESLRSAGDNAAAEQAYRETLARNPDRANALLALAGLLLLRHEAAEARVLLQRCCALAPDDAQAWNTLGLSLRMANEPEAALAAFHTAQRVGPGTPEAFIHGVDAAIAANRVEDERERLELAYRRDPLNPAPLAALGVLSERLGRRSDAIDLLEAACALAPDDPAYAKILGGLLTRSNQTARAEEIVRRIAEREPDNTQAGNDLAATLMRLHRHAEARTILQTVLEQDASHTSVMCNLANATVCTGRQAEAVAIARRAIALEPAAVLPRRSLCNTLPYLHGTTGRDLLQAMRDCSAALPRLPQPPLANDRDPDRRLRVGLLSGSLRTHPVGWLTVAGIENLDPARFAVTCLVQNAAPKDLMARRYRTVSDTWIEVDALNDAALAETARGLNIDILIDLGGYGDLSRMMACANRLAPVQIKWVGMQAHTSGLAEMDWFLTDRWETPPGFEAFYSERLLRLPDGYVCYSPPTYAPDVTPLPALRNGFVTFGCFNNLAKLTPELIAVWGTVLRRLPTARLVLKTHQLSDRATADELRDRFAAVGVAPDRLEMRGASGHRAFMGEYGGIDLVLDPFPYSGGLTTCEALWMGVPTVTCPGEIFASRHSASHMSNAGLGDWVAPSIDAYVAMAVERAADLPRLAALRADLRERVRASPLCDGPRFGRNLGEALRQAWRDWCATTAASGL